MAFGVDKLAGGAKFITGLFHFGSLRNWTRVSTGPAPRSQVQGSASRVPQRNRVRSPRTTHLPEVLESQNRPRAFPIASQGAGLFGCSISGCGGLCIQQACSAPCFLRRNVCERERERNALASCTLLQVCGFQLEVSKV